MDALFHATRLELLPGQLLGPFSGLSHFQQRQQVAGLGWLEAAFEERRPDACCSRLGVIFATQRIEEAAKYILAEPGYRDGTLRPMYYRVTLSRWTAGPLMLVGYAARFQNELPTMHQVIDEYWNMTHEWQYLEYFGPTMVVEEQVKAPPVGPTYGILIPAAEDLDLAKTLWPPPK